MEILKILKKLFNRKQQEKQHKNKGEKSNFKIPCISQLKPFIYSNWRKGIIASITLILASLLSLPQPLFTKFIIDDILVKKDVSLLTIIICFLISILLLEAILSFLKQFYFFRFEQNVIFEIQQRLFERVLRFPKSFFDSKQTGYLMSRLSGDVFRLRILFSSTVVEVFTNVLKFVGGIIILWRSIHILVIFTDLPAFWLQPLFICSPLLPRWNACFLFLN